MKKLLILMLLASLSGYSQSKFNLDLEQSLIVWKGYYVIGGGHEGIMKLNSGHILMSPQNQVTDGNFTIDMTTIKNIDEQNANDSKKLDDHLKSDDFFSVDKFPKTYFSIEKVVAGVDFTNANVHRVTGSLTMKGITNKITFPATIVKKGSEIKISGEFKINRTKWDVIYNSASFFSDLKDGIISDEIGIMLDLTLKN